MKGQRNKNVPCRRHWNGRRDSADIPFFLSKIVASMCSVLSLMTTPLYWLRLVWYDWINKNPDWFNRSDHLIKPESSLVWLTWNMNKVHFDWPNLKQSFLIADKIWNKFCLTDQTWTEFSLTDQQVLFDWQNLKQVLSDWPNLDWVLFDWSNLNQVLFDWPNLNRPSPIWLTKTELSSVEFCLTDQT